MTAPGSAHSRPARADALIQAAFAGIAERGLEGLRLRDVAERAGIDHSTLHHYFATKQDLIAAVVAYATRQFWPTMPADLPPRPRLRHHLRALGRLMREWPELFVVLREFDLRGLRDPAVAQVVAGHEAGWRAVLAELFQPGAGWPDWVDPARATELVIATVKGASHLPDRAPDILDHLERLFTAPSHAPPAPS